jgi:hypothetical protein
MYIVADIFGGRGNTNQMAADVGCQVPRKNEANNQQRLFQKRPDGSSIIRLLLLIYMKGAG